MDVKFKNQICNCAPSEIEGYGRYAWTKGSYEKLKNIPRLPDELFEMIRGPGKTATKTPRATATATEEPVIETPPASKNQLDDFRALCSCLSLAQIDNYDTWIKFGMILKRIGAPLSLYEEVSNKSKKSKPNEC